jgi:L-fuconolactonase
MIPLKIKQMKIIDTHIHIWDFTKAEYEWLKGNTSLLNRAYSIEEVLPEMATCGIQAGILVQAANNLEDTDWMLEVAARTPEIMGVVAWLPLQNPTETERLLTKKYLQNPYFCGIRHLIHDEPDAKWLLQETVLESLAILAKYQIPFDVVGILPAHIETVLEVARLVPSLKMVFDHLNQPPISTQEQFGQWGELIKQAAANPNFYAKISGLGVTSGNFTGWSSEDIKPYIAFALAHFGEDRCFFGGDWPVALLAGQYIPTWKKYEEVFNELLSEEQKAKVYHRNAEGFYKKLHLPL